MRFLEEAARYFENRPTGGEDSAHWANVYNAENCRKADTQLRTAADLIRTLIDNDPDEPISDAGHTVLDQWRQHAADWLGRVNNEPPER